MRIRVPRAACPPVFPHAFALAPADKPPVAPIFNGRVARPVKSRSLSLKNRVESEIGCEQQSTKGVAQRRATLATPLTEYSLKANLHSTLSAV